MFAAASLKDSRHLVKTCFANIWLTLCRTTSPVQFLNIFSCPHLRAMQLPGNSRGSRVSWDLGQRAWKKQECAVQTPFIEVGTSILLLGKNVGIKSELFSYHLWETWGLRKTVLCGEVCDIWCGCRLGRHAVGSMGRKNSDGCEYRVKLSLQCCCFFFLMKYS